mmetsp:Transcript_33491/g.47556  ORF Transcript_33491/g.47556 Transcript_33491/m.47556 type:complete len:146 (+) Transcript_33491:1070-1507(+)
MVNCFILVSLILPQIALGFVSLSTWGTRISTSTLYDTNPAASSDCLKLIIAGAPASGKGTQCATIKEEFGVIHLSTGDMLRAAVAAETEVGVKAKDYMDSGKLVPDDVIIGIVSSKLLTYARLISYLLVRSQTISNCTFIRLLID